MLWSESAEKNLQGCDARKKEGRGTGISGSKILHLKTRRKKTNMENSGFEKLGLFFVRTQIVFMLLRCYTSHFLVFSPRFSAFIATKKFTYVHFSSHPINTTFFVQLWNRCSDGCFFFSTELQATKELREVLLTNFCCLFAINLLLFPSIEIFPWVLNNFSF